MVGRGILYTDWKSEFVGKTSMQYPYIHYCQFLLDPGFWEHGQELNLS